MCTGVALYDGLDGLTVVENAMAEIQRGEQDPAVIVSIAQQQLNQLMSASDWQALTLNDEPGEPQRMLINQW